MPCIIPEMPYCPACEFGRVTYPAGVDTYVDVLGGECNWECDCTEDAYKKYHCMRHNYIGEKDLLR